MSLTDYIENMLNTISQLELGQKLSIRMGTKLVIDKNPNRAYRLFTGSKKREIYGLIYNVIDLAVVQGIRLNEKLLQALDNYIHTYNYRKDVVINVRKIQAKIKEYLA